MVNVPSQLILELIKFVIKLIKQARNMKEVLNFIINLNIDWISIVSSLFILVMFIKVSNKYKKIEKKLTLKTKVLQAYFDSIKAEVGSIHLSLYLTDEELRDKELNLSEDMIDDAIKYRKQNIEAKQKGRI